MNFTHTLNLYINDDSCYKQRVYLHFTEQNYSMRPLIKGQCNSCEMCIFMYYLDKFSASREMKMNSWEGTERRDKNNPLAPEFSFKF